MDFSKMNEYEYIANKEVEEKTPSWGDFFYWLDEYYAHGEYGVIYTNKRTPYELIKVINCDITDGDSNYDQTEFFEENWKKNIEGLVKIYSFARCEAKSGIMNQLSDCIAKAGTNYQQVISVLDLDVGDELAMWTMEKAAYVGLTHPDLTRDEMIERVAHAAYNVQTRTGYAITDLKPQNYGFRNDGSAIIFDFNLEITDDNHWGGVPRFCLADYTEMITSASNTKV